MDLNLRILARRPISSGILDEGQVNNGTQGEEMPRYAITEKAGQFVAAHRNTGVGIVLELTEKQADHELRLGTLVPLDGSPESAVPMPPASTETGSQGETPPNLSAGSDATRKVRRSKQ